MTTCRSGSGSDATTESAFRSLKLDSEVFQRPRAAGYSAAATRRAISLRLAIEVVPTSPQFGPWPLSQPPT